MKDSYDLIDLDEDGEIPSGLEENIKKKKKSGKKKKTKKLSLIKEILQDSLFVLIALCISFLVVKFVAQRTVVEGHSMETTLTDGDNLIIDKISYRFHDPERFDVIVFQFLYAKDTYYVKRIIGLPGETVRIDENGNIYINEVLLEENYGAERIVDPGIAYYGFTLGENEYFVMGDNRNHSSDSRTPEVAAVDRSTIIGRVWLRVYPFNKMKVVR